MTQQSTPADSGVEVTVARPGGVSYLRIPAHDLAQSAEFYRAVFGWQVRGRPDAPSFSDGTGHVIGHWRTDLPTAGEAGIRPYIYVTQLDDVLRKAAEPRTYFTLVSLSHPQQIMAPLAGWGNLRKLRRKAPAMGS